MANKVKRLTVFTMPSLLDPRLLQHESISMLFVLISKYMLKKIAGGICASLLA